jgi:hypothetical protein
MAQKGISPEDFVILDESCAAFDREVLGQAEVLKLKELAADLGRRYPADPAELAAFSCCGGGCSAAA